MSVILLGLFLLAFVALGTGGLLFLAWFAGTNAADDDARQSAEQESGVQS